MSMSDYDTDIEISEVPAEIPKHTKTPKTPKTKAPPKRKIAPATVPAALLPQASTSSSPQEELPWAKKSKKNIFSIIKSEDRRASAKASSSRHGGTFGVSSFTTRVSGGSSRRTITTNDGDFYLDLKIYKCEDIQTCPPEERYKKALSSIKLRLGDEDPDWDVLQELLTLIYRRFNDSEPTFYTDKIAFK